MKLCSSLSFPYYYEVISFWILLSYLILIKELILGDIILALLSFSWYLYFHFPFYHSLSLREQLFYCLLSWSNRILNNKWFSIVSLIINNVIFFFWGYRSGKGQGKEQKLILIPFYRLLYSLTLGTFYFIFHYPRATIISSFSKTLPSLRLYFYLLVICVSILILFLFQYYSLSNKLLPDSSFRSIGSGISFS